MSEDRKAGHNGTMKSTFRVINQMVADGVIEKYAVGDAVAALLTDDLDVLISVVRSCRREESDCYATCRRGVERKSLDRL